MNDKMPAWMVPGEAERLLGLDPDYPAIAESFRTDLWEEPENPYEMNAEASLEMPTFDPLPGLPLEEQADDFIEMLYRQHPYLWDELDQVARNGITSWWDGDSSDGIPADILRAEAREVVIGRWRQEQEDEANG